MVAKGNDEKLYYLYNKKYDFSGIFVKSALNMNYDS